MRALIIAFVAVAGALVTARAAAPAEEATVTWYDVELVVFRNLDTRSTESWPADAGVPAVADARPLFPPNEASEDNEVNDEADAVAAGLEDETAPLYPGTPTPYVPLDPSAHQLGNVVASLERSSRFEPILHVAWTQPPLEREQAPYLRITLPGALDPEPSGENFEEILTDPQPDESSNGATGPEVPAPDGEVLPGELPEFLRDDATGPALVRPLDGVAQLSVSRYLHLDLDLVYLPDDLNSAVLDVPAATREWTEEEKREREERRRTLIEALARGDITLEEAEILSLEPERQLFQGFRLNQFRRLRSRELHYFDHPVFGVIVMVTPREVSARTLELDAGMLPAR